jgi:hypothetical protein
MVAARLVVAFGDPVDVSSGLFILDQTDLSLPDVIPLTLKRTYRPADPATRPFGVGTTTTTPCSCGRASVLVDLILPNGTSSLTWSRRARAGRMRCSSTPLRRFLPLADRVEQERLGPG